MAAVPIDHYENFPVASWLCPARLRPAILAIYHFARTADDIADEGNAAAGERLALLNDYRTALLRAHAGEGQGRWSGVFVPLARCIRAHALPLQPLTDLLSAFAQDTANPTYAGREALLDYCARSANPIGRLLLHLCKIDQPADLARSDAVCSALQLINFWQDLSVDLPRGRHYVPQEDAQRHGLDARTLAVGHDTDASRALMRELCGWARQTMQAGSPLVHRLPGRMGWELRFVVQGGLRVLDRIEASGWNALSARPTVGRHDLPLLAWRALRMPAPQNAGDRQPSPDRALP